MRTLAGQDMPEHGVFLALSRGSVCSVLRRPISCARLYLLGLHRSFSFRRRGAGTRNVQIIENTVYVYPSRPFLQDVHPCAVISAHINREAQGHSCGTSIKTTLFLYEFVRSYPYVCTYVWSHLVYVVSLSNVDEQIHPSVAFPLARDTQLSSSETKPKNSPPQAPYIHQQYPSSNPPNSQSQH